MNVSYSELSLAARMAIALRCVEDYCAALNLTHPELAKVIDYLWEFFIVEIGGDWKRWEQSTPALLRCYSYPEGFNNLLISKGIHPEAFQKLLTDTTNTVFHTFYGGVSDDDDKSSLECLQRVIEVTSTKGIKPPRASIFANALFADSDWGISLSIAERDAWRYEN